MEISIALHLYETVNKNRRLSPETIAKDNSVTTAFASWLTDRGIRYLKDVTKDDVRLYIIDLKTSGVKSLSINGYRSNLKRFFTWCVTNQYCETNPFDSIRDLREEKPLPSYVPMREMEALFESFDNSSTLAVTQIVMFEFFYATGIRTTELIQLHTSDIDLNNYLVNVRHGKGNQQRIVPFPSGVAPVIKRYLQIRDEQHFTSPFLFPNAHGARLNRSAAFRLMKEILIGTSSAKKGAHTIRHSYASHLLARGADLKSIGELLGHRSVKTTVKYTHLDIESKRAIYERAHPKA